MDEQTKIEIKQFNNRGKDFKSKEVVILVVITCIFSFFAGNAFARVKESPKTINQPIALSDDLMNFVENYQYIVDNYYKDVDEAELLDAALKGVMAKMGDPYTVYMDEEDYEELNLTLQGSYSGLGISIYKDTSTKNMVVASVFKDSPADKAGIKVGDIILSVNGKSTKELETSDFSSSVLKGSEDSFELELQRDDETKKVTIQKSSVVIPSIESKTFEKNGKKIGYLAISIFANNTYKQFKDSLKKLEKEKIDSLIIDVRDNTGGHLTAVSNIISLFVDSSHIAYQLEQDGEKKKIHSSGEETKKYPIVFLANGYSASASEVLIGSLKDNLNAKIIGEKTYGKGTVQGLVTLSNGDQFKVTTKKWLTPNGNWVNDTQGFAPDINVSLQDEYYENPSDETDNQLQRALEELSK